MISDLSADPAFDLDPGVVHLNPGAFGVVPRAVLRARNGYQRRLEANPTRFHRVELFDLVNRARAAAAGFLGTDGVALVRSASEAIATVLAAIPFAEGDEILTSEHAYQTVLFACRERAHVRAAPFPLDAGPDEVAAAFVAGLRPTTRLVVVDAITSATALVLPVAKVARVCRERGVPVFVDAAHVPGHIDQRPADLGVDFWVGSFHKWAYAPRAVAGLYLAPRWREQVKPLVPSWLHPSAFPRWFDHAGGDDYSAWLALPEAIDFWHDAGGWDAVTRSALLLDRGVRLVADAIGVPGPVTPRHAPLMRLLPLPRHWAPDVAGARALYEELSTRHRIEVPVVRWRDDPYLRIGATIVNRPADYQALASALSQHRSHLSRTS
ncbi:aminotransferase class V-fold PLP-dependent enzyme [Actinokineospora auranticolor]|uniref:Isopenicillin-N epimerase n=1 Tax=Actinokineospora auranticolor TaxID=155976 RepID=A0A2S6H0P9_9PSEU|nr:aminotransferase class V-fold PLP-dependent enzyme [Actinokineospora auranticolor]PPK71011.1 isopenicillin-N epimerase [Actinokineospora auranticolor]